MSAIEEIFDIELEKKELLAFGNQKEMAKKNEVLTSAE